MITILGILLAVMLVAGFVLAMVNGGKKIRIIVIAINCIVFIAFGTVALINQYDKDQAEEDSYDYVIHSGSMLSSVMYYGNVNGYEVVHFSGMCYNDYYASLEENVEIDPFCKIYKYVRVYSKKNETMITGTSDADLIELDNGFKALEANNIVKIKRDLGTLELLTAIYGAMFLWIIDVVFGIIALVTRIRAKNRKK